MQTIPLSPVALTQASILVRAAGTNPATEKRAANAWIAGRLNIAGRALLAPLASEGTVAEDGIFDVILASGALPKPGKRNAIAKVLDAFPGQPYHPAKTDAEGNVVTDAEGRAVLEKHQVIRTLLVIEQPSAE